MVTVLGIASLVSCGSPSRGNHVVLVAKAPRAVRSARTGTGGTVRFVPTPATGTAERKPILRALLRPGRPELP